MSKINWQAELPRTVRVIFSSMEIPNACDELQKDVAAFRLPGGNGIDVEWIHDQQQFAVRLFCGTFDCEVVEAFVSMPEEVVTLVRQWTNDYSNETISSSDVSRSAPARTSYRCATVR